MLKNKKSNTIALLDTDEVPSDLIKNVIYKWNGYQQSSSFYSVPAYLEKNSSRLKAKYINFINSLGDTKINEKTINDHLSLKNGYNLWWMSLVAEKSPFKSPKIFDCLRLLALEEIIISQDIKKITLHSSSKILAEAVKILCANLAISFSWNRTKFKKKIKKIDSLLDIYRLLPVQTQNFISYFRSLCSLWSLKKQNNTSWFSGGTSLTIFSYFDIIEKSFLDKSRFRSGYWGSINRVMSNIRKKVNWVQIFSPNPVISSPSLGLSAIKKFNKKKTENGFHAFLEGYLNFSCVVRSCLNYLRLIFSRWHWRDKYISLAFQPKGSSVSLWPFLKNDWYSSIRGLNIFQNFLLIELFDSVMADIPKQKKGLYLLENQNWEKALVHAWRRHGHGQLTGVVNTPIRYWDLRYFDNLYNFKEVSNSIISKFKLRPDFVAINGPSSLKFYLDDGYPSDELVPVEALRYENLSKESSDIKVLKNKVENYKSTRDVYNVLILGQILWSQTNDALTCLDKAVSNMNLSCNFTLKPHPNCPISKITYPNLNLKQTNDSIEKILPKFDLVIVAGSSTSALDAYIVGLEVIVFLDKCDFNYSPLRGFDDVMFVTNPKEMSKMLELKLKFKNNVSVRKKTIDHFFWLDERLLKWYRFLKN
jgi:surface carbohydrate biosynthesis protein (TIGR04326 family)